MKNGGKASSLLPFSIPFTGKSIFRNRSGIYSTVNALSSIGTVSRNTL
ncbi:MAG: hypothetical protein PUB34_01935 [Clostridia bacterium]|nr:hypothetical protein [Clostridia bacterium]